MIYQKLATRDEIVEYTEAAVLASENEHGISNLDVIDSDRQFKIDELDAGLLLSGDPLTTKSYVDAGLVRTNAWQEDLRNEYVAGSVVSDFSLVFDTDGTTVLGFSGRDYIRRTTANPVLPAVVTRPSEETYVWNEGTQSYEGEYWLAVLFAGARWRPFQLYFERDVIEYEGIDNVPRQAFCQVAHTSSADTNPAIVGATIFDVQGHDADHPWEPVGASLNVSTQTGIASADPFQNASHDVVVRGSGLGTDERVGQWYVDLTSTEDPGIGVNVGVLTVPIGTGIAFGTNANTAYELQFSELVDPDNDGNDGTRWWFAFADGAAQFVPAEVANGALTARVFLTTARVDYGQITRFVFDEEQFEITTSDPHIGHAAIGPQRRIWIWRCICCWE